jgi:peptidoglycan-N-acetylglucosamine deacetylase
VFRIPAILPWMFPKLLWRVQTEAKEIYLTFDDGPVPGPTEFVLDTLKKYNAKATFFCIGDNIQKHSAIFKRTVEEGHSIGNHTFNHIKGWGTSTEKYVANVESCESEINKWLQVSGSKFPVSSIFFRPPYGRIRTKQIKALKNKYQIVMWDVLTSDYSQSLSPEKCLAGSIKATRPGSIIVFHDSMKAEKNMSYTLPRYLDCFSQQGYSFKVLPNPNNF